MTDLSKPVRANVQHNPKARADIHGRTEKDLKHGERLQFMTQLELDFISEYVPDAFDTITTYKQSENGGLSPRMMVSVPSQGGKAGLFLGFVRKKNDDKLYAVVDMGLMYASDPLLIRGEKLRILKRIQADEMVSVGFRNQGKRVQRAMRDVGGNLGFEDVALKRILDIARLDLTFLKMMSDGFESGEAIHGMNKYVQKCKAKALTVEPLIIRGQFTGFVGERCVNLLMDFGLPPSNIYYGLHDVLRAFVACRKQVEQVCPELLIEFDAKHKEAN